MTDSLSIEDGKLVMFIEGMKLNERLRGFNDRESTIVNYLEELLALRQRVAELEQERDER